MKQFKMLVKKKNQGKPISFFDIWTCGDGEGGWERGCECGCQMPVSAVLLLHLINNLLSDCLKNLTLTVKTIDNFNYILLIKIDKY